MGQVVGIIDPVVEHITSGSCGVNLLTISESGECGECGECAQRVEYTERGECNPLHVAIFATLHTVHTNIYPTRIARLDPSIRVSQQACPDLAELIDRGAPNDVMARAVRRHVATLLRASGTIPDICVLACTHFPIVQALFLRELPAGTRLVSQAELVAGSVQRHLGKHPPRLAERGGQTVYLTTGAPDRITAVASRYFGRPVRFRAF
jgi:glutamate racemase